MSDYAPTLSFELGILCGVDIIMDPYLVPHRLGLLK